MTCSPGTNSSSGMGSGVSGSLSNQGDSNFLEMKPKQMTLEDFCKGKKKYWGLSLSHAPYPLSFKRL